MTYKELSKNRRRTHPATLKAAQQYVQKNLAGGVRCPCCAQYCKMYRRPLNSQMARFLIWLVREYESRPRWIDWRRAPDILRGGDYAKLQYWGLIESRQTDDPSKRTSGLWRPTKDGIEFAHRRRSVPASVYVYNNQVHEREPRYISIEDALGEHFNYQELMGED